MELYYSVVKYPHYHTTVGRLARTTSDTFYWDKSEQCSKESGTLSDYAILAHNSQSTLVGIQKLDIVKSDEAVKLEAIATYVWPLYREEGVAMGLWCTALKELKVTEVCAQVISDRGKTLIESLKSRFPEISFTVRDAGARKLRALKGKGKLKKAG